jgi:hypothetical protein
MEPKPIYFDRESPDYNLGLYGKPERLAANRVVLCMLTEFGLVNDARMQAYQVNDVIESLQPATGSFKEPKTKVKLKSKYIKQKRSIKPNREIIPDVSTERMSECSLLENTS